MPKGPSKSAAAIQRLLEERRQYEAWLARITATADAAAAAYALAARVLDRAARKGLIHKNNAARQKSRLAALVKRLKEKASA